MYCVSGFFGIILKDCVWELRTDSQPGNSFQQIFHPNDYNLYRTSSKEYSIGATLIVESY